MSLRPRKDGEHIGPKGTVSARKLAEMLGLKDAPPPEPPMPDTPAAARLRGEGKAKAADELMATAKENYRMRTIPAGRDAMAALGIRPEDLPVGAEAAMGPPAPPTRADGWQSDGSYDGAVNAPAAPTGEAAELAAQYHAHAARIAEMAQAARGDAAREAKVAAEARASAEVGERLKEAGIL